MNLEIKEFDKDVHLKEQRALSIHCFPEIAGTPMESEEHYYWKFHCFPAAVTSYEYAAFWSNKLVGYYAAIPYQYYINDQLITIGMVCDVMTHSDMRGKGVFTKLGRFATEDMAEKGVHFTTGYPIRPEVIPGHIKVGWDICFKLPMFICFIKTNATLGSKKLGLFSPIGNLFCTFYNNTLKLAFVKNNPSLSFESKEFGEFNDWGLYEEFFKKWGKEQTYYLNKDQDFLSWRLTAPKTTYWINALKMDGAIIGFAISRLMELEGIPTLSILDYMVLNQYSKFSSYFFECMRGFAKENNAEVMVSMMSNSCSAKYHTFQSGFIKSPFVFKLITKKLVTSLSKDDFMNEKNWHLAWIDSDDL